MLGIWFSVDQWECLCTAWALRALPTQPNPTREEGRKPPCIYAGVTRFFISLVVGGMAKRNLLLLECVGRWWQPCLDPIGTQIVAALCGPFLGSCASDSR